MKTVVICSQNYKRLNLNNIYYDFSMCKENVTIGIIDTEENHSSYKLSEHSVLVKIKAFSCNYRDKALMLHFNHMCETHNEQYGCVPFGSDFVAEVVGIGSDVKKFKIGDRIIPDSSYPYKIDRTSGGIITNHASQRFHIFNENTLVKIPDSLPDDKAAAFTIVSQTVYSMIRRLELVKGSVVLVTAATSNTSLAAISVLVNRGMKVYAISSNKKYEEKLSYLGIYKLIPSSALVNHTMKDYIGEELFDAIIDPFFDIYMSHVISYIRYNGKYVFCGFYNQSNQFDPLKQSDNNYLKALSMCLVRNISVIGNCLGNNCDLENAIRDYEEGLYNIIIDSEFTGDDIVFFLLVHDKKNKMLIISKISIEIFGKDLNFQ